MAGTYRRYEFDITTLLQAGEVNAIAVEVFAPEPDDLAFTWVDWNPMPADKGMGRAPARVTLTADAWNAGRVVR